MKKSIKDEKDLASTIYFSIIENIATNILNYKSSELLYEGDLTGGDSKSIYAIFNAPNGKTIAVSYLDKSSVDITDLEYPYSLEDVYAIC